MPSRSRTRWIAIAGVLVVGLAGAGYAAFAALAGGGPAAVGLSSAAAAACTATPTAAAPANATSPLDGTWSVRSADSFVGYRVREKLAMLPAPSDAVGRTTALAGELTIAGLAITKVEITADMSKLASDKIQRDQHMQTEGLETDRFPTATFDLTSPIAFASQPAQGKKITAAATGTLTLHGVTRPICVPVQASWSGGAITVVGSVPVSFADFGIVPPDNGFVSVEDHGTMEFQLAFVRQS